VLPLIFKKDHARAYEQGGHKSLLPIMHMSACAQETRESLRVRLEGNIVVVDEAHNLVDAVNNVHSAVISAEQLSTVLSALDNYHQRFRSLLAPGESFAGGKIYV